MDIDFFSFVHHCLVFFQCSKKCNCFKSARCNYTTQDCPSPPLAFQVVQFIHQRKEVTRKSYQLKKLKYKNPPGMCGVGGKHQKFHLGVLSFRCLSDIEVDM